MSDDEYYADSPYDEFEEMLWDADPGPNLADDLAQHASYSPVWQDDPVGELQAHHSDWEYYSDDYYDDDPAVFKSDSDKRSPSTLQVTGTIVKKQGRKRKLDEFEDSISRIAGQSLRSAIKGTVWAKDETPKVTVFEPGQYERVALLTDWRKRFKIDKNRSRTSSTMQLKRDESWANDLSLEDMGLVKTQDRPQMQQDVSEGENNGDVYENRYDEEQLGEDEGGDEDEEDDGAMFADEDLIEDGDAALEQSGFRNRDGNGSHSTELDSSYYSHEQVSSQAKSANRREGITPGHNPVQRNQSLSSSQNCPEQMADGTPDMGDESQETDDGSSLSHQSNAKITDGIPDLPQVSILDTPDMVIQPLGRKRKISLSSDDGSTTASSRPLRRAKRVA